MVSNHHSAILRPARRRAQIQSPRLVILHQVKGKVLIQNPLSGIHPRQPHEITTRGTSSSSSRRNRSSRFKQRHSRRALPLVPGLKNGNVTNHQLELSWHVENFCPRAEISGSGQRRALAIELRELEKFRSAWQAHRCHSVF